MAACSPVSAGFASDPIFAQIKAGIEADKSVAKQINGVYLFDLTADNGSNKKWTVDLKANPGVYEGEQGKADCTVSMKESDFLALASGKLNGQQAFMQGKLKIKGNMGLAMKLGTVMKSQGGAKPAAAGAAASDPIFAQIKAGIEADKSVAKQINGVYLFDLTAEDGTNKKWTVDLKANPGVYEGEQGKADCTVSMKESDFLALASGKLNGQQAFMQGKLKIKGNMGLAMKLGTVMKSQGGAKPAAAGAAASDPIFAQIKAGIEADKSVAKQINGVYLFDLTAEDGTNKKWTVDLKANPGVYEGEQGKADCTVSMKESDFLALASGKLNGQQAFMQGKLKIKGNMGLAMKLGTVMKSQGGAKPAAAGSLQAKL